MEEWHADDADAADFRGSAREKVFSILFCFRSVPIRRICVIRVPFFPVRLSGAFPSLRTEA
jgi:hypothetical protein